MQFVFLGKSLLVRKRATKLLRFVLCLRTLKWAFGNNKKIQIKKKIYF